MRDKGCVAWLFLLSQSFKDPVMPEITLESLRIK
jgi:hypothetical protein